MNKHNIALNGGGLGLVAVRFAHRHQPQTAAVSAFPLAPIVIDR